MQDYLTLPYQTLTLEMSHPRIIVSFSKCEDTFVLIQFHCKDFLLDKVHAMSFLESDHGTFKCL